MLVHDYLEIDPVIVYRYLQKIDDFKRFAEHVATWIR
ncbi:MAG: HepT-like ribonuclease domain-containing protein [Desulfotomaculales bacterium]